MIHSPRSSRRGAVLVQFAFLAAVLLGIAALASDLGLVRTTQVAMQNAADAAALEGMRWLDEEGDQQRRQYAKDAIHKTYDEDLDLGTPNTKYRFGAGPVVETLALGAVHGAGGIVPTSIGQYQPTPQPNSNNAQHGDLVAGSFLRTESNPIDGVEASDYSREDFVASDASGVESAPSFLVRLRRTPDRDGLDALPGVSSTGGGVPTLFGLGPLSLGNTGAAYDVRRDGVAVRATAIADARPVLRAGPRTPMSFGAAVLDSGFFVLGRQTAIEGNPLLAMFPGYTGLPAGYAIPVLDAAAWTTAAVGGDPVHVEAIADGTLRQIDPDTLAPIADIGRIARVADNGAKVGHEYLARVGQVLHVDTSYQLDEPFLAPDAVGLVPVVRTVAGGVQIVGFYAMRVVSGPTVTPGATPAQDRVIFAIEHERDYVIPTNATAIDGTAATALLKPPVPAQVADSLWFAHQNLQYMARAAVLAR